MRRALLVPVILSIVSLQVGCGGGGGTPQVVTISVTPSSASVFTTQTKQFTATVTGSTNTGATWTVVGGAANGTVSSTGLYTAPATVPANPKVTVTATALADATKSATATVTVTTTGITINVSPATVTLANFVMQQFNAAVSGTTNTAVTWQVNGTTGGSQKFGFISTNGLYAAPSGAPTKATSGGGSTTDGVTITITAVSQANSAATGTASVTIVPGNQNPQSVLPIQLGTSGGNAKDKSGTTTITCCGGTLGSLVTRGGTQYILSNNHVLARSDLGVVTNGATQGDAIIQPGLIDSPNICFATGTTTVANLSQFFNLETDPAPHIDAALAQVVPGTVDPGGNILYLGATADPNGVPVPGAPNAGSGVTVAVNRGVAKSGRSTGLTCSTVMSISTTTSVQYQKGCGTGTNFTETYTGQVDVLGGSFSAEGDSGSLIVTQDTADPVALLFAGSDADTIGNPVQTVLNFFKSGSNAATFVGTASPHAVIGCTLPVALNVSTTVPVAIQTTAALRRAIAARDAHSSELMGHPEVQAIGAGTSYDNPAEPAVLFFVTRGQTRTGIPAQVDGVRTRIVEGELFAKRGAVSLAESAEMEKTVAAPQLVYSISEAETDRAKVVHSAHADELMKMEGVQGVGVGSSVDSPGEAALVIFTIRGVEHPPIPPVMDGLRTRVRESSRFRAGFGGGEARRACQLPKAAAKTPGGGPSRRKALRRSCFSASRGSFPCRGPIAFRPSLLPPRGSTIRPDPRQAHRTASSRRYSSCGPSRSASLPC